MRVPAIHPILVATICVALVAPSPVRAKPESGKEGPPASGDEAADFELPALDGKKVKLSASLESGPVALVVLRGFPGYQCPLCTEQVAQLLRRAGEFRDARATVLLVYPGATNDLTRHAKDFISGKDLPANFHLLVDADYEMINVYRLRWKERNETAYPSTFVIDKGRKIRFSKVSKTHAGRAEVDDVLKALRQLP